MLTWLLSICLLAAAPALGEQAPRDPPVTAGVTLGGQRVAYDEGKHALTVEVTVKNDLAQPLSSVEVGWLLAPTPEALAAVPNPGAIYLPADDPKHGTAPTGVTAYRRIIEVAVEPHGSAPASFTVPLTGPAPDVYRTHLLGYTLADADLSLLLRLLTGAAAADEHAAVAFFAVAESPRERLAARARLATEHWTRELEGLATSPVPGRPTAREAHERVFVVRALGVVGGARAEELLASLRERTDLASFDELLRVISIDRLRGTRLETPLAFAVPPNVRTFRELVDAALEDARRLPDLEPVEAPSPSSHDRSGEVISVNALSQDGGAPPTEVPPARRPFDLREQLGGLAVVVASAVITLWVLRRHK